MFEHRADGGEELVDLGVGDDQRRCDGDEVADAAHDDALGAAERDRLGAEHRRRFERRLAAARQQVDGADELVAADFADRGMAREGAQLLLEVRADIVAHALDQLLALEDGEVGEAGRGRDRVAAVGEAVRQVAARFE